MLLDYLLTLGMLRYISCGLSIVNVVNGKDWGGVQSLLGVNVRDGGGSEKGCGVNYWVYEGNNKGGMNLGCSNGEDGDGGADDDDGGDGDGRDDGDGDVSFGCGDCGSDRGGNDGVYENGSSGGQSDGSGCFIDDKISEGAGGGDGVSGGDGGCDVEYQQKVDLDNKNFGTLEGHHHHHFNLYPPPPPLHPHLEWFENETYTEDYANKSNNNNNSNNNNGNNNKNNNNTNHDSTLLFKKHEDNIQIFEFEDMSAEDW